ncbi:MAG TPA: formyltransferase family protein [Patescibacteria group bacterium]|nr:formyltransferase family protein [Patescibacteria group bacterium]
MIKDIPRLGVLASGEGLTFERMVRASHEGRLHMDIPVVISTHPDANVLQRAQRLGVGAELVNRREYGRLTPEKELLFGRAIIEIFRSYDVDAVSQNGLIVMTPKNVIDEFEEIDNDHGGPKYETAGTMGRQTQYVMLGLMHETGRNDGSHTIIHRLSPDGKVDAGPTVAFAQFEMKWDDTPETLQERQKKVAADLQIKRWNSYAEGEPSIEVTEPRYIKEGEEELIPILIRRSKVAFPRG